MYQHIPSFFVVMWLDRRMKHVMFNLREGNRLERHRVKLIWHCTSQNTAWFGKGWYKFVKDKNLEAGDSITVLPTRQLEDYNVTIMRG